MVFPYSVWLKCPTVFFEIREVEKSVFFAKGGAK